MNSDRSTFSYIIILIFCFSSCASNQTTLSKSVFENYNLDQLSFNNFDLYLDRSIVLERRLKNENSISLGKKKKVNGYWVDHVKLSYGSKGKIVVVPKKDRIGVSFSDDPDEFLMFGPNAQQNNKYVLLGRSWKKSAGVLTYGGYEYYVNTKSAQAGLKFNKRKIGYNRGNDLTSKFEQSETINKPKPKVYKPARQKQTIKNNSQRISMRKSGGVYEIPVKLNGVLDIHFILDSGAADVAVSPDVALTLQRTGTIREHHWLPDGVYSIADGSTITQKRFILEKVKIGKKIVYNVTASVSNTISSPMLLGQSVLEKFGKYSIDYSTNSFILE